jgi:hypothetical protein
VVDVDVTGSGKAHHNAQVAGSTSARMVTELGEAGLSGVAENGRVSGRLGVFAFYRAGK